MRDVAGRSASSFRMDTAPALAPKANGGPGHRLLTRHSVPRWEAPDINEQIDPGGCWEPGLHRFWEGLRRARRDG